MDLRIIDTSNYIYIGAGILYNGIQPSISRGVKEVDGYYEANTAPYGGVKFLIDKMIELAEIPNTIVIPVFDSAPIIKRQMYAKVFGDTHGYKGTRKKHDPNIGLQREFAKTLLTKMEFPVQCVDGYEADDIIYSLVYYYKNDFDNIYIHTLDSDLSFLVDKNVSIRGITKKNPKNIDIENYSYSVHRTKTVGYNLISLVKLCEGDKADNIPGIGDEWGAPFDKVVSTKDLPKCGDLDFCRKALIEVVSKNPMLPNASRVLDTFDLLVPLLIPEDRLETIELIPNKEMFVYFKKGWEAKLDTWGFEDAIIEYINEY